MENNLMIIAKRFIEIKSEFIHSGYNGVFLENNIMDIISDEILSEIGEIEKYDEIKKALVNMFFLGNNICECKK